MALVAEKGLGSQDGVVACLSLTLLSSLLLSVLLPVGSNLCFSGARWFFQTTYNLPPRSTPGPSLGKQQDRVGIGHRLGEQRDEISDLRHPTPRPWAAQPLVSMVHLLPPFVYKVPRHIFQCLKQAAVSLLRSSRATLLCQPPDTVGSLSGSQFYITSHQIHLSLLAVWTFHLAPVLCCLLWVFGFLHFPLSWIVLFVPR